MKKHKAQLSISRPSYGDGRELISVTVTDEDARMQFLEIEIPYADFARCLTGGSNISCMMEVRGLKNVGKRQESEGLEFPMPESTYSTHKKVAAEAALEHTPEGWVPSTYFGSKGSFYMKDGQEYARTSMSRWVDKEGV